MHFHDLFTEINLKYRHNIDAMFISSTTSNIYRIETVIKVCNKSRNFSSGINESSRATLSSDK